VRFAFRLIGRLIGFLLVLTLIGLAYVHVYGFPSLLTGLLEQQMERTGLAARFGLIRLDVFRGIVASDTTFADARSPERVLAQIDEVVLEPNWRGLLRRERPLKSLRIANAVVAVPTPPDEHGSAYFTARDAYALILFEDDGKIVVDRLTGVYCGIQLYVTGRVKVGGRDPKRDPAQSPFQFVTKVVRELNGIKVSAPPQLDLDFDVDLAQPLASRARVRLHGVGMELRGAKVDDARILVQMQGGAVELQQFEIALYRGVVKLGGRYDFAAGRFDLQMTSTTDPAALTVFAPPAVQAAARRDLRVYENPTINIRYFLTPETGSLPQLSGNVDAGRFAVKGVEFLKVQVAFENQGPEVQLRDGLVVMHEGRATGQGEFNIESTEFHYQVESTVDPTKLLPLMTPNIRHFVEPSTFAKSPKIVATVRGDFVDPDAFAYDAMVTVGPCSYRGVQLQQATGKLRLRESQLDVQDLVIGREEGDARGSLLADFSEHRVSFDIACTANPSALAPLLGPKAAETMRPYRFGLQTTGHVRGLVDFENPTNTAWVAQVKNEGFGYWKFTTDRSEAELIFTNNTFQVNKFSAEFYDGQLAGTAQFVFVDTNVTYRFTGDLKRGDLQKIVTAASGSQATMTGNLRGHLELTGSGTDLATLRGQGNLTVSDGVLWEGTIFGIFSHILGGTKATRAKATFTIEDNWIRTDDLDVAAGTFTGLARGKVNFDGLMDFRVQAQFLRGIPGINILTKIIGTILEYQVGGTISKPKYRAANLPKEILPHE